MRIAILVKFIITILLPVVGVGVGTAYYVEQHGVTPMVFALIGVMAFIGLVIAYVFFYRSQAIALTLSEEPEGLDLREKSVVSAVEPLFNKFGELTWILDSLKHLEAQNNRLKAGLENADSLHEELKIAQQNKSRSDAVLKEQKSSFAKLANELALSRDTAEKASAAKSDFLATMSHEIRTPMNGVISMVNFLMETELTDEQRDIGEILRHSGDSLLTVINDILDISKLESGKVVIENSGTQLKKLIDETHNFFKIKMSEKGLDIAVDIDDSVPEVFISDATRIRQILFNLIGNAIKFTEKGGITVRVTRDPDFHPTIDMDDDDLTLRFEVEDTGIGIPDDIAQKLFQKFSQADATTTRKYGGSGLGLAICKQLTELLGGKIGLESRIGEGSVFHFTVQGKVGSIDQLEIAPADLLTQASPDTVDYIVNRQLDILIVDDNQINLNILHRILASKGHKVASAMNGAEACSVVGGMDFDLILMDVHMPVMGGIDAVKAIREMPAPKSNIPIIGCTADAFPEQINSYLQIGMDSVVTKPINKVKLLQSINSVFDEEVNSFILPPSLSDTASITPKKSKLSKNQQKDAALDALLSEL